MKQGLVDLELKILLAQLPKCWDKRHEPLCLALELKFSIWKVTYIFTVVTDRPSGPYCSLILSFKPYSQERLRTLSRHLCSPCCKILVTFGKWSTTFLQISFTLFYGRRGWGWGTQGFIKSRLALNSDPPMSAKCCDYTTKSG